MLQGKVYFVAAGLSDIELITRKGYQLICQADVILHDHLIPLEQLPLAKTKGNRDKCRGNPTWLPQFAMILSRCAVGPITATPARPCDVYDSMKMVSAISNNV